MHITSVGSVCSGIEAATIAWKNLGWSFKWYAEVDPYPSKVLKERFGSVDNLGDLQSISALIKCGLIDSPDLICGGTPCQAFSLAGWQEGLGDDRGNLTLSFVDLIEANDQKRYEQQLKPSVVLWENVEGVLCDKTNAFGCFISSLAGFGQTIRQKKWPKAGIIRGVKRNIAWRILDAKFFGVPQQRKRLYVLAGGPDFYPERVLFEKHYGTVESYPETPLIFQKDGHTFETFRAYTDCLYASYATKWNGNAAAKNGSLFVLQNNKLRRFSPLECERLMGLPDNHTLVPGLSRTKRYQAIGNSWAVPVVRWIGQRIKDYNQINLNLDFDQQSLIKTLTRVEGTGFFSDLGSDLVFINEQLTLNCSTAPEKRHFGTLEKIVSPCNIPQKIYISPVGCQGILRRQAERNLQLNSRLKDLLIIGASEMSAQAIEKQSRRQKRGKYST